MSTINTSSSGTSYLSGAVSGLDTSALIAAAKATKLKKSDRLDDKISAQTYKISAYTQMQTYAKTVQDALEKLKSTSSGSNAFTDKQVTTKSSNSTAPENILSATATASAKYGSHKVVVSKLATSMSVTGSSQTSSSAALGYSGSFTIGLEGYAGATINITASMSLKDIAAAIDAVSATTGVEADIMQTGNGSTLVLTGIDTAKSFSVTDTGGVLAQLGIVNGSGAFTTIAQAPQQAVITLNGATITSDSNTLENVLAGVTINLDNASPDTTITIEVGNNVDGVKEAVQEFIEAYNTLRYFLEQMQAVGTDGAVTGAAYLFGDATTRSITSSLAGMLSASYGDGQYNSLGSLGITINEDNELELDEEKFDTAMDTDFAAVASMFSTTNGKVGLADKMYDLINLYANDDTGSLQKLIDQLEVNNTELTAKSDAIKDQADAYEETLVTRYSVMETKILSAQILKKQIEAILKGSTSSDD